MTKNQMRTIPALEVRQWLPAWDKFDFNSEQHRAKPPQSFYLFSMPARELRSLTGIVRRVAKNATPRTDDLGIQRQHDPERSDEIRRFVECGYPWSTLSQAKRDSGEFRDLRKPGWLPTAIVLNVLPAGSQRNGATLDQSDIVSVIKSEQGPRLELPYERWDANWGPTGLPPFEVIDGQHRLWAFDAGPLQNDFELPVVAFFGLDISWQAYLFWTINIKPKRINSSLAFDLYPLLRSEDWLEKAEGHAVYRETRAQELTEILWSFPESPWYDRINMLGERQNPWVSQSAWIKSLTASLIRSWDKGGRSGATGGLFGGRTDASNEVLGWNRAQQAAFLISAWQLFKEEVHTTGAKWATALRTLEPKNPDLFTNMVGGIGDYAFYGQYSLINSDQGVRGFLTVLNDIFYMLASTLKLNKWRADDGISSDPLLVIPQYIDSIKQEPFYTVLGEIANKLARFDWRTGSSPDLDDDIRLKRLVLRGSSGYKELRSQLLEHIASFGQGPATDAAIRLGASK